MKINILNILLILLTIVIACIVAAFIVLEIYVWLTYGGKPITEIPSWALWLMFD